MNRSVGPAGSGSPATNDPRWSVVERVLASQAFSKSARLSQFLVFVCERALTGNSDQINETQVGVHVFDRHVGYNPGEDSIVRSHARLLRKRLDDYFEADGRAEPYFIRIPKGGYVPYFEPHSDTPELLPAVDEPAVPLPAAPPPPDPKWRRSLYLVAVAAVVPMLAAAYLYISRSAAPDDYSRRFWGTFFSDARPALIVPSDTALVIYEVMMGRDVRLQEYVSQGFRQNAALRGNSPSERAAALSAMPYSNMVDLQFCWQLARAPGMDLRRVSIRAPKDLRTPDLKGSNVILIGARRADPWVEIFDQANNFQGLHDDRGDYILNRSPKDGESSYYVEHKGPGAFESYAVISHVPGLGPDERALLISGTTSAGTEAGLSFLLNPEAFGAMLRTLSAGSQTIPWFEILLRAEGVDSRAPGRYEVAAWRRHSR